MIRRFIPCIAIVAGAALAMMASQTKSVAAPPRHLTPVQSKPIQRANSPVQSDKGGECCEEDDCCDQCSSCRKIEDGVHLDVLVLRPIKSSRRIHVDHMRQLIQDAHFKSYEAKKKVYVVSEADRMTDEAANCFLKVLEEPPTESVFLLLTSQTIMGLL